MRKVKARSGSGPEPPIRFKLYPGDRNGSNAYFEVLIFGKKTDLWRYLPDSRKKRAVAYCGEHGAAGSKLGELLIGGLDQVTDNTVSHELCHAAILYTQYYLGKDLFTYWGSECLATILGDMVSDFWKAFVDTQDRTHCYGFFETIPKPPSLVRRG